MNKKEFVTSIRQLKEITKDGRIHSFALLLAGGFVYSRKNIRREGNLYHIENCIDDSHQSIWENDLDDEGVTHIGEAIKKRAFIMF